MIAFRRQIQPVSPVERPRGVTERDWREAGAFCPEGLAQMRQEKERLRGMKSFWKPRDPLGVRKNGIGQAGSQYSSRELLSVTQITRRYGKNPRGQSEILREWNES